jgi:hypothetical protein
MHPLALAILKFIQIQPVPVGAFEPPKLELPHALIEPSALRAAKTGPVE